MARGIATHHNRPDCTSCAERQHSHGYGLAGKLRASQALAPSGRIIAVTGYGQDADRQRASDAGFDAHLVKPVTMDVLIDALGEPLAE